MKEAACMSVPNLANPHQKDAGMSPSQLWLREVEKVAVERRNDYAPRVLFSAQCINHQRWLSYYSPESCTVITAH